MVYGASFCFSFDFSVSFKMFVINFKKVKETPCLAHHCTQGEVTPGGPGLLQPQLRPAWPPPSVRAPSCANVQVPFSLPEVLSHQICWVDSYTSFKVWLKYHLLQEALCNISRKPSPLPSPTLLTGLVSCLSSS